MMEQEVAELLRAQFPELAGLPVRALGAGTDHEAFDLGGVHVFRFPRHDEAAATLDREARRTAWLAPRVPLPIPRYHFVGEPTARFPRRFVGYRWLPGTPALGAAYDPVAIGPALGAFLRALHALDPDEAAAHGYDEEPPDYDEWAAQALHDLHAAEVRGHVDREARRDLAHTLGVPPPGAPPRRVLHADFAAEHVLLHAGAPTGVIDWSDAVLGDPARDLAGVVHWGGAALLAAVLDAYGPVDADTIARSRWYATCRALADLSFGEERALPPYVHGGMRALGFVGDDAGFARCVAPASR